MKVMVYVQKYLECLRRYFNHEEIPYGMTF